MESNIKVIQTFEHEVLRNIGNASQYVRNKGRTRDLTIPTVEEMISKLAVGNEGPLYQHKSKCRGSAAAGQLRIDPSHEEITIQACIENIRK